MPDNTIDLVYGEMVLKPAGEKTRVTITIEIDIMPGDEYGLAEDLERACHQNAAT